MKMVLKLFILYTQENCGLNLVMSMPAYEEIDRFAVSADDKYLEIPH